MSESSAGRGTRSGFAGAHPARPPEVPALLAALAEHEIRYVLIGSVAAGLYGAGGTPGDLDVTPSLDPENRERLARLLLAIEAHPAPVFGAWVRQPNGERRWQSKEPTEAEREAWHRWVPDAGDPATFDHLFHTRLGNFDLVPDLTGTYDELLPRARRRTAHGVSLRVAHVDELLAALTVPRREKDRPRVLALRRAQRRPGEFDEEPR